jgi:hypothetical protein
MPHFHAAGMREFAKRDGHHVEHLRERFGENTPDITWIGQLASEGDWIIVSGDVRISRNPVERKAWHESNLAGFFFAPPWSSERYWKMTADLVRWWEEIERQARRTPTGHGFLIHCKSKKALVQIYPERRP